MGFLALFRQEKKPETEPTLSCGECGKGVAVEKIIEHWMGHTTVTAPLEQSGDPLRDCQDRRNVLTYVLKRGSYGPDIRERYNEETLTADYFTYAIAQLHAAHPRWNFQFLPIAMGGTGEYLKSVLVIAQER